MSLSSSRREGLLQRRDSVRETIERVIGMDRETTLSALQPDVRDRLSTSRMMPRLALRRARHIAGNSLFAPDADAREQMLSHGGAELIESLTIAVGTHVLWEKIVRVVQRRDREDLNADLGLDARAAALFGRERNVGVTPLDDSGDLIALAANVRREGALCWACWLLKRNPASARRLRVLTPDRVSKLIGADLPASAEDRERRRLSVTLEIDEMLGANDIEPARLEVA